jgi:hypothetical protein
MKSFVQNLETNHNLTMKEYLFALFISALTVIAPAKAFVVTIALFVLSDTALAIYWTVSTKGWSSFKSSKLFNIVVKSFFYMSAIMLAFLVDTFIFEGSLLGIKLLITKGITLMFCWIELKSIDETSMKLGNKSIWVHFRELIGKSKDIKKDLNDVIEDKKEE